MGVAELGLNLFSEVPPMAPLIALRRLLHENATLRQRVFGAQLTVPSLFTYDPRRIFVEFDSAGRLIVTTLEHHLRIPLIRYATGDRGGFLELPAEVRPEVEAHGIPWELFGAIPIVVIHGRGEHASAGNAPVYPEEVKEGIYRDHRLAALITANFRLVSGPREVRIRIQLSPGVQRTEEIEQGFAAAIAHYVTAPIKVLCEPYETFVSGMALDYERKFSYLSA
jgi:phenylacetate-coenzyme A ligase PaaK-like adenylate-forming protein